jgi:prolyl-tRNA editing enzyme YbaK/EbsC (Cys-tRNA(Pro) deacylase)
MSSHQPPLTPAERDLAWAPEPVRRVLAFLRSAAIESRLEEFQARTPTARDAAAAIGCELGRIVKTLVFVCDGVSVLALLPGDRRADEAKIAAEARATTVRIATPEEVLSATGFEPGAVAPFPQRAVALALLERTLLQHKQVWIGAGSDRHMAALSAADLQELAGARAADLVEQR